MGAALVREAAVTALLAARAATAARAPQPDVALTPADAAGFPPDESASDSSDSSDYHSRWDAFDTYEGIRRHAVVARLHHSTHPHTHVTTSPAPQFVLDNDRFDF